MATKNVCSHCWKGNFVSIHEPWGSDGSSLKLVYRSSTANNYFPLVMLIARTWAPREFHFVRDGLFFTTRTRRYGAATVVLKFKSQPRPYRCRQLYAIFLSPARSVFSKCYIPWNIRKRKIRFASDHEMIIRTRVDRCKTWFVLSKYQLVFIRMWNAMNLCYNGIT